MPIALACPSCASRITAPDRLAGKTVKCPKCGTAMSLPAAEPGFEVVEDVPAPERPVIKARPLPDDRPKRKLRREADDEDEGDDRPGRRRKDNSTKLYLAIAAVVVVIVGGALTVIAVFALASPTTPTKPTAELPAPWVTFDPLNEQFAVEFPANVRTLPEDTFRSSERFLNARMRAWGAKRGDLEYGVFVLTFTGVWPEWATEDEITRRAVKSMADGARLPGPKFADVTLDGRKALQAEYVINDDFQIARGIMVDNRFYGFLVVRKGKPVSLAEEDVRHFFDTVHFR